MPTRALTWFQVIVQGSCLDLLWGGRRLSSVLIVCAGDPAAALRLTTQLISLGADVSLRSRWTNMNALHYAAYFDVPELIRVLLKAAKPRGNFYTRQYFSDRSEGNRSGGEILLPCSPQS